MTLAITASELGERLRSARQAAGLTQQEAADVLRIARTSLLAIEKGSRGASQVELKNLASRYRVELNELLRPTARSFDLEAKFRKCTATAVLSADESMAVKALNRIAAAHAELEESVGRTSTFDYPRVRQIVSGDVEQQAEDMAMALRQRLGYGLGLVVDLVSVVEVELGVRVYVQKLPSKISGLFAYEKGLGACIMINEKHPRERQCFSLAHEIAHFLTTREEPDVFIAPNVGKVREERFADAFAAAFLLPAATLRDKFRATKSETGKFTPKDLVILASSLNASIEAVCRRLEKLQLLPEHTFDSLRDRGFSSEEIRSLIGESSEGRGLGQPPRLLMLAAEAYSKQLYSEGQLMSMLSVTRAELRKHLDLLGRNESECDLSLGP